MSADLKVTASPVTAWEVPRRWRMGPIFQAEWGAINQANWTARLRPTSLSRWRIFKIGDYKLSPMFGPVHLPAFWWYIGALIFLGGNRQSVARPYSHVVVCFDDNLSTGENNQTDMNKLDRVLRRSSLYWSWTSANFVFQVEYLHHVVATAGLQLNTGTTVSAEGAKTYG